MTRIWKDPHPGKTQGEQHSYIARRQYSTNNVNSHIIVTSYKCSECNHTRSYNDETVVPHNYQYVSDYHGAGLKHYIIYKCKNCNQHKTTPYTCTGYPCYIPLGILPDDNLD